MVQFWKISLSLSVVCVYRKMSILKLHKLLVSVMVATIMSLVACSTPKSQYITVEDETLGTFVQVKCNTSHSTEEVRQHIKQIDTDMKASMSIFDPSSLLSQLNANTCNTLDEHLIYNITLAEKFYTLSGGAYDITVKPLTDAWGFGRNRATNADLFFYACVNLGDEIAAFLGSRHICLCFQVGIGLAVDRLSLLVGDYLAEVYSCALVA